MDSFSDLQGRISENQRKFDSGFAGLLIRRAFLRTSSDGRSVSL